MRRHSKAWSQILRVTSESRSDSTTSGMAALWLAICVIHHNGIYVNHHNVERSLQAPLCDTESCESNPPRSRQATHLPGQVPSEPVLLDGTGAELGPADLEASGNGLGPVKGRVLAHGQHLVGGLVRGHAAAVQVHRRLVALLVMDRGNVRTGRVIYMDGRRSVLEDTPQDGEILDSLRDSPTPCGAGPRA